MRTVPDSPLNTWKTMLTGFLLAALMVMPAMSLYLNMSWPLANSFPFSWLGILLNIMITFFHELGHTVAGLFYGYVALPGFDLIHGGGMTYYLTGQVLPLNLALDFVLIFCVYHWRDMRSWQILCTLLLLFHVATAYIDIHRSILSAAGPFAETGVGGFMLSRAWLNRAPRGVAERLLNAAFGFGFVLHAFITGWSIMHDPDVRQVYLEQKGGHGFGDFDQIANNIHIVFNHVVQIYLSSAWLALFIPVVLYALRDRLYLARYED